MSCTSIRRFAPLAAVVTAAYCLQAAAVAQQAVDARNNSDAQKNSDARNKTVFRAGTAALHSHITRDGDTIFALGLQAAAGDSGKRVSRDHVILVDTSASQFGEHRTHALAVLKSFLAALPAGDRVSLMAVDVASQQLSAGFVAPQGDQIEAALLALNQRFPAGATNLPAAITAGLEQLPADRAGSLVYIGDGMSTANLLQRTDLRGLLATLRDRRVPMHSYAVGPQTDLQLLGIIGQQTGGMVQFDSRGDDSQFSRKTARAAGERLAAAVHRPVYYPASLEFSAEGIELLPALALPLRGDRQTIYLGKGQLPAELTVTLADETSSLQWQVAGSDARQSGNTFLAPMWKQAVADGGLSVGLAGHQLFAVAQDEFEHRVNALTRAGERAIANNNLTQAEEIGLAIKEIDPNNVRAGVLIGASRKKAKITTVAQVQDAPDAPPADPDAPPLAPPEAPGDLQPRTDAPTPAELDLIETVEEMREVREQELRQRVGDTIEYVRGISGGDPDAALAELKRVQEAVTTADIDPIARQQMTRTLASVRADVIAQREVQLQIAIQAQNRLSEREAQLRLQEAMVREEEKLAQLIDQVRALMEEGRHGRDVAYEEAEAVASAAVNLQPGNGIAAAALYTAEAAGQLNKAFRLRALRADRFLETLYQVELSHVPFPDEPPIRWPPAEVWKALTERRKKWASVDLHKNSPAEQRIQAALEETTEIEFVDTSLSDVMAFIADLHDITIILKETALAEEGIATDEPITQVLSGISLASTLKIILEPLGLTYIIEDEVMKITTEIDAEEQLSTRVYPVGDLVIPIVTPTAGGLGQGLGGVGGLGGMGLGGGSQFGAGGGSFGGGMGMGGLGGGLFSLPPARIPRGKPTVDPAPRPVQDAEVQKLLDGILNEGQTSQVNSPAGQAMAQVNDPLPERPFRFDKETIESVTGKKKRGR